VEAAAVNLASERASVEFDAQKVGVEEIIDKVEKVGYGIAKGEVDFGLKRIADDNDAHRLEKALTKMPGVMQVEVNLASEHVHVEYIPTMISQIDLRRSIQAAGFGLLETTAGSEDAEEVAREKEIAHQKRLLTIGLIFTIPLFLISMGMDFSLLPMTMGNSTWIGWLMLALATPVQFYVGAQYYSGAWKALVNKSANMDVLISLGSTTAYIYSLAVLVGLIQGHLYFETSAVIIHSDQGWEVP